MNHDQPSVYDQHVERVRAMEKRRYNEENAILLTQYCNVNIRYSRVGKQYFIEDNHGNWITTGKMRPTRQQIDLFIGG